MADNSNDDMIIAIGVDLATIKRGLKRLEQEVGTSTARVQKHFDAVSKGIDGAMTTAMQGRINAMVGLGTKAAKEWTGALADQGKELERLRAKYSPLFATITSYKTAVADIKRAHSLGAISADEMTSAIQRERQAALASTAAIKGRNAALQVAITKQGPGGAANSFNTSNLAAQGFDIASTAAFMPWYTVALQQGPQVAQVFNDIRSSGASIGPAVAGAFAQLVNPVSLVTIGVIAAASALIQYISSSKDVKSADDILKGHADTISLLKDRYGDAAKGLKEYARESTQVAKVDIEERLKAVRELVSEQAKITASYGPGLLTGFASTLKEMDPSIVRELRAAFADLNLSISRGEPDILRFREALSRLANNDKVPESIRKLAQEYRQFDEDTMKAAKSVPELLDQLKLIEGVANGQADAINRLTNSLRDLNKIGIAPLTDLEEAQKLWRDARRNASNREERDDADLSYRRAIERIGNANPTVTNSDGNVVAVPLPGKKPSPLGEELDKKAETVAQRAANAYRDLLKSADDRIGQLRLETELMGQFGVATDAARFRLDLLQQSEDKGRSLTEKQRAEIEQKVSLYEKYSKILAETKLQQDLLNSARFSSLSKQDQQIVTMLRQYGLPEDLTSSNAGMIRQSLQGQEIADGVKSFGMQFSNGLISEGKSLGEAFGDAVRTAAANQMQKALESVFSQIGSAVSTALMPKLGGGVSAPFNPTTTFGDLLGVGNKVSASIASAGSMAAYAQAIKNIESGGGNYGALGPITRNGDRTFGAYQVMGNNIGPWSQEALGRAISSDEFLNNPALQDKIFAHKFGGYVDRFGPSGAAQAWFGGPGSVGKGGMGADMLGTTGNSYVKMFETNVAKMGNVAGEATKGLGGLNGGLQAIAQNFGGGAGLGGFNWGSLFSSSFQPTTTLGNFLKGIPGFDGGGHTGAGSRTGGMDGKGGFLAMMHPDETVIDHTRLEAPRAPRLNPTGGPRIVKNETALTVQILGANGDDHVRMLVQQGVQTALRDQNEHMRRRGFGDVQAAYTTDRG